MYQINAISKKFKLEKLEITVFQNISFIIEKGEWVALTGASGCGKTTLLHLLGGLDKPSSGEIIFNNNDLAKMSAKKRSILRRNKIGFIFQTYNLFPELNALENVLLPVRIIGKISFEMEEKAKELLAEVGLSHRETHRPAELSGGEQQRVAIARALIMNPEILLADEPTGNLDDENSVEIMKIFQKLHKELGITILMVTHQKELTHFATRTLHLEKGHIL